MQLPQGKTTTAIAFTCMIDIFAITLLVFASRDQPFRETLPLVATEDRSSVNQDKSKPMVVELKRDGQWTVDRSTTDLDSLIETMTKSPSEQKILIALECDADGRGAVSELLQLTHRAQQSGFANRLYVLTQDLNTEASRTQ